MKLVSMAVGRLAGLLALVVWLLWWLMVPPPDGGTGSPAESDNSGVVSYLPLDAESVRMLPEISSPIWLPSGIMDTDGPGAQEGLLKVPLDLSSPMPYVSRSNRRGTGAIAGADRLGGTGAFRAFTERHMARPLSLPSVVGELAESNGVQLQVEPPVPDLESSLGQLEKNLGAITASITTWNVLLILNADAKGQITHVLLERSSGDPEIDDTLVRWAYQLSVGPGATRSALSRSDPIR